MAKVYDVPADDFISRLAEILKTEDMPTPSWISFVKTGAHATVSYTHLTLPTICSV